MFEPLEARRLMSTVTFADGTVATQSGSGTLTVKGSGTNGAVMNVNVIENGISQTQGGVQIGLGNVVVQDLNSAQEYVFYHVNTTKPVNIQGSHSGNDTINYDGTSTRAHIQGGSGGDMISVMDRGAGGSTVQGGHQYNTISIVFSHHATVTGGNGGDTILVNSADADEVTMVPSSTDLIVVNGGGGTDTIVVYDGNAKVNGGGGYDVLDVDVSNGANVSFTNVESVNVM